MADAIPGAGGQLRILHVFRAPLGGLFRHVLDVAREQVRRGHAVGLFTDSSTGGPSADRVLAELAPDLELGLLRVPMRRNPSPTDVPLIWQVAQHVRRLAPTVVHGHGSKGGLYARMSAAIPGCGSALRVYTPHGGSLNYRPGTIVGRTFMRAERIMAARTDLSLFESAYVAERYRRLVGEPQGLWRVVRNGIAPAEFVPVLCVPDAADIVYVGELRAAKGIDVLIEALAEARRRLGRPVTAILAGTGPDRAELEAQVQRLGLADYVVFAGLMPARQAFARGRLLVVPSRAESLPYVVLEAAGARVPTLATRVGGIPEIFGPYAHRLFTPDDVPGLADRIADELSRPEADRSADAASLADFVRSGFALDGMVDGVLDAYRDALAVKVRQRPPERRNRFLPSAGGLR